MCPWVCRGIGVGRASSHFLPTAFHSGKSPDLAEAKGQDLIDITPDLAEGVLQEILVQEPFYRQLYDGMRTLRENYQAHVFLSARIDAQLIQKYPEHFHAI